MDNQFIGEHLVPGKLGHFFVITSFVAALFSTFCYLRAVQTEKTDSGNSKTWARMGRYGFYLHFGAIIAVFSALYFIITNHLFEYHYAWEHSSYSMPGKYLLSCFWEGQQGSFMLWSFWHCVLGVIVMNTAKDLETRTMTIIAFVQVLLGSMLLGFYFGNDVKIGGTPFDLLRHAMQGAPIFAQHNYLEFIKDGNGLNVLLQNYWMVIHPPILFLGFATTLIPFAYCIAALWKGDYQSFVKPVLVWSLFNGAVLGTGIMMGGAWAYESLNFGGYWAWDPVENASLVPWLTLIAGMHTLIEYKSTGRALAATFILLILTHLLVWYSTFLTRTGILGTTSVHAFTGDGASMFYHLLIVLGMLLVMAKLFLLYRWKSLPQIKTEEETFSREFWLFVGSAILFISALHIAIMTSIPVWSPLAKYFSNKDFSLLDPMSHYNNVEVWIAVLIGILSGSALYMKFKHTDSKTLLKNLSIPAIIAFVMAALIAWGQKIDKFQYDLMLFSACYGVVASLYYAISVQKGKLKKSGPAISHFGFGLVLLGILLSSFNKHVISNNMTGEMFRFNKKSEQENLKENMENVILYKNAPVQMGEYFATYVGDSSVEGKDMRVYYKVDFQRKDSLTNKITEAFTLFPDAFINPKGMQGLSANPSTKHYWNKDIFTFINAVQSATKEERETFKSNIVSKPGDTILLNDGFIVFNGFSKMVANAQHQIGDSDMGVTASLSVFDAQGAHIRELSPCYILKDKKYVEYVIDTIGSIGLKVKFDLIIKSQEDASANIMVNQNNDRDNYIVLKALVFPYINVLWLGVIVMVFGFFTSIFSRIIKK